MNLRGPAMRAVAALAWLPLALTLTACQAGAGEDISSAQPYAHFIGQKYCVVGKTVHAYGVFESLDEKMLSYVVLMPTPSLSGPEIAFERIVPAGQVITVVGAWRRSRLFDDGIYYVVTLEKSDLPQHVPIRLELSQGNEGNGAELNAAVYEKLPRRN